MIYLGSDHGGFKLKEKLKPFLESLGYQVFDFGPKSFNPQDDYPDYVIPVAEKAAEKEGNLGIVLCRNGVGASMAANKVKGVRAALVFDKNQAQAARSHDNTNVLALGADYLSEGKAKKIVEAWLKTPFSQAKRHQRRLEKISRYEEKH